MADHGYSNFYTPFEYESYQQYQQHPSEDEQISTMENILNMFMQQSMINMQNTNQRLTNLSCQLEMIQVQLDLSPTLMDIQTNNQSTHGEQENIPTENEKFGEIAEEGVDQTEEDLMLEGCCIIETPHKVEFPQERSYTEEAKTVDNEEVVIVAETQERLLSKEELCEQQGKKVSKAEVDRVIDEICALFRKQKLGRIWTPHQLYLKFMEFIPKQRDTKDDVLSVSFWPP